jgi:uncharacterized protein (UPF0335 family)
MSDSKAGGRLASFVDRIENLIEQQKGTANDLKEVKAEAKADGFDPSIIMKVIKLKDTDPDKRKAHNDLMRTYCSSLGINYDE